MKKKKRGDKKRLLEGRGNVREEREQKYERRKDRK